jgi:hypothetical protein
MERIGADAWNGGKAYCKRDGSNSIHGTLQGIGPSLWS